MPWKPEQGDFSKKMNLGFRETTEPWVFAGADDLAFEEGWDERALAMGERGGIGVIGTNDGANPAVKRGGHSTHSLVRRAYVEEYGSATFDGSGEVYSEVYDHQYVDNELVATAQLRGRWAFAGNSMVRHLHPLWGTAPMDATYKKALREGAADHRLFVERMEQLRRVHRGSGRQRAMR